METKNQPDPESTEATISEEVCIDLGFQDLFNDPLLADLILSYDTCMKNREVDIGFNLFNLISPIYHRENLHSDIIASILDPYSSHGRDNNHLRLFIEFLNQHHGLAIDEDHYRDAEIFRETGKIDILIRDKTHKRAIIIENKISGTADQPRQIPKYLDKVTSEYAPDCDAILYLNLSQIKSPSTTDWSLQDIEKIKPLLKIVCAYNETESDLYHGWLTKCIESPLGETDFVILQYSNLIKKLARNIMNEPIMEEFYKWASFRKNSEKIRTLSEIASNLPAYRIRRIQKRLFSKPAPFNNSYTSNEIQLVVHSFAQDACGDSWIKIHVDATQDQTILSFWDNKGVGENTRRIPAQILEAIGMIHEFEENQGWFTRSFPFPEGEDDLEEFVGRFLNALNQYCQQRVH